MNNTASSIDHGDTRREAYYTAKEKLAGIKKEVFEYLSYVGGRTTSEIAESNGIPLLTVRPAVTALFNKGLIVDSGKRSKNEHGKNEIVWEISRNENGIEDSVLTKNDVRVEYRAYVKSTPDSENIPAQITVYRAGKQVSQITEKDGQNFDAVYTLLPVILNDLGFNVTEQQQAQ